LIERRRQRGKTGSQWKELNGIEERSWSERDGYRLRLKGMVEEKRGDERTARCECVDGKGKGNRPHSLEEGQEGLLEEGLVRCRMGGGEMSWLRDGIVEFEDEGHWPPEGGKGEEEDDEEGGEVLTKHRMIRDVARRCKERHG
jgi:hypothetical protein